MTIITSQFAEQELTRLKDKCIQQIRQCAEEQGTGEDERIDLEEDGFEDEAGNLIVGFSAKRIFFQAADNEEAEYNIAHVGITDAIELIRLMEVKFLKNFKYS